MAKKKQQTTVRVESTPVSTGLASHLSIVVTGEDGREVGYRGGPEKQGVLSPSVSEAPSDDNFGQVIGHSGTYKSGWIDYAPEAPKKTVDSGEQDFETLTKCFDKTMSKINQTKTPYKPASTNSNAFVWTMLNECGCSKEKPVMLTPGFGTDLLAKFRDDGKDKT